MANSLMMKIGLIKGEKPKQLLPKDILVNARMFSGEEVEKQIMDAVKKHSMYSHYDRSNTWMQPNPAMGTSTAPWGYAYSTTMLTSYTGRMATTWR